MEVAEDECDSRTWGFLATDVPNPPECVLACRNEFLRRLSLLEDETLDRVCEALSDTAGAFSVASSSSDDDAAAAAAATTETALMWTLYCCDAQRCGVDNLHGDGRDPNVNWFINSCQNIGHTNIIDPGPPDSTYTCRDSFTQPTEPTRCEEPRQGPESLETDIVSTGNSVSTLSSSLLAASETSMATPTSSSTLGAGFDTSQSDSNDHDADLSSASPPSEDGISTGVKVTIALATLAVVVIIILAIIGIRRYKARPPHRQKLCEYIKSRYHTMRPASRTPSPPVPPSCPSRPLLSSPTKRQSGRDGVPLTPPPPLKERRLLSSASPGNQENMIRKHSRYASVPGPSRSRNVFPSFPASPVFAPTKGNLARRSAGIAARSHSNPIPAPLTAPSSPPISSRDWAKSGRGDGSLRSISSGPTATSSIVSSAGTFSRPRVSTLDLMSLQSPGPPPNRALPSTPPSGPMSPYPLTPHTSVQPGEVGVAIGLVSSNPASGIVLGKESQDLCDLTEQTYREWKGTSTGGTWSSTWRTYGGGSATPPVNKSTESIRMGSPVLEEVDLERMGGRY